MIPVQPGWVIVPSETHGQWFHLVGWEDRQPVIAMDTGIHLWRDHFGEDSFCVATLGEWMGNDYR